MDEKSSLFSDNHTEFLGKFYQDVVKEMEFEYNDTIAVYKEYIKFIARFIKEFDCENNSIMYSILLKNLIESGIFSDDGFFYYTTRIGIDIDGYFGLNIPYGKGCCRHVSFFHHDVFKELGLTSIMFYCLLNDKDDKAAYKMNANHVTNLIDYNGGLYSYDICNDKLFKFVNQLKMKELYNDNPSYLYYKPHVSMVVHSTTLDQVVHMLNVFDTFKDKNIISKEEYMEICNKVKQLIVSNKKEIRDFKNGAKKYTKEIIKAF